MSTRRRMDQIRDDGAVSRTVNGHRKRKAQASRDARMADLIKKGKFPYTPAIQSWVSRKLGIPFSQLKEEDVRAVAK